jgi:hypothetical protein
VVRDANVLLNMETSRIMVIDFEQVVLMERPRLALGPVVPIDTTISKPKWKPNQLKMQDDILAAMVLF